MCMETNQVTEHLQVIRTLMERSALYRRALAPIMIYCGALGIVAGVTGWLLQIHSARGFVFFWDAVAAMALIGSFLLVRRQALKDSEPFWSPPTRRVAQAMLPPLSIGFVIGTVIAVCLQEEDSSHETVLILGWVWLYGCAIHSAGFFMPRGIKLFGWLFILAGCVLLGCLVKLVEWEKFPPHFLMGSIFGGLHLAYGAYLYLTEKGKNVS
jgi:hypothetical protein